MDKNQVTGLVLISALLLLYTVFFAPDPDELPASTDQDSVAVSQTPVEAQEGDTTSAIEEALISVPDSIKATKLTEKYGLLAPLTFGKEEKVEINSDALKLQFSTKGGLPVKVELKDFYTWDKQPLVLFDEESSNFNYLIGIDGKVVSLSDIYFVLQNTSTQVSKGDTLNLSYKASLGDGRGISINYRIPGSGYQIYSSLSFENLTNELGNQNLEILWNNKLKRHENDIETSRNNATINFYTAQDGFDYLSETSTETEEIMLTQKTNWATFKQRFFSTGIIPDRSFDAATFRTDVNPNDSSIIKYAQMALSVPRLPGEGDKYSFRFYYGPNNYQILKKIDEGFSQNVYLGWLMFAWFNKFLIIPVFNFLEQYMSNYGIIIIILVFFIKLLLFPLTYSSYKSFAKQRVLKPELDKLKEKHGEDMQAMQQEQMKLFQQVGINPLSGCIPLLLQMPILLAMFNFFPNSVELRQEGFLWAHDLSTYDSVLDLPFTIPFYGDHVSLFCLLMTLSTILYQWSNNQMTGQLQGPMKTVTYLMPIMFLFVLNSFSAGLTFYYFISNLVTFGQQAVIRRFIDEEKIKKILDENRKRNANKKKSKWQLRVEEAMKARDETKRKKSPKK
jgi:YidC/Oxa1 family membrane protein insertase